jgi:hypothetical protein
MMTDLYDRRPDEAAIVSDRRQLVTSPSLPSAGAFNGPFLIGLEAGVPVLLNSLAASEIAHAYPGIDVVADARAALPEFISPSDTSGRAEWRDRGRSCVSALNAQRKDRR